MTNVLIIEDDLVSRLILAAQLKYLGLECYDAESLEKAFEILSRITPDLICLDLLLPEHGGLEFLKLRKESSVLKTVPVIVVSIRADLATISSAMREGANGYLIKPVQKELLVVNLISLGFPIR